MDTRRTFRPATSLAGPSDRFAARHRAPSRVVALGVIVGVFVALAGLALLSPGDAAAAQERRAKEDATPVVVEIVAEEVDEPAIDQLADPSGPTELPPGWCYDEAVGTYWCPFKIATVPEFDDAAPCPEGYVLDPNTGKCINDQLSVPDPVPADVTGGSPTIVPTDSSESSHPEHCPEGWVEAQPPLNPELGCINDTLRTPPCPEGLVQTELGCLDIEPEGDVVPGDSPQIVASDGAYEVEVELVLTFHECPEGSAIHPAYVEFGCIPYGAGPWAE